MPALQALMAELSDNRAELARRASTEGLERILAFVRVMRERSTSDDSERSRHMAANLLHVLDRGPADTKAIIWAHNSHIGVETFLDREPTLGHVLRELYGDAYFAFALEFNHGSYQTRMVLPEGVLGDLKEAVIPPAPGEAFSWYFARMGIENCIVSLRKPRTDPAVERWLSTPQAEHGIWWPYRDPVSSYEGVTLLEQYDGIVFAERSTPTHPTATALETVARREGL